MSEEKRPESIEEEKGKIQNNKTRVSKPKNQLKTESCLRNSSYDTDLLFIHRKEHNNSLAQASVFECIIWYSKPSVVSFVKVIYLICPCFLQSLRFDDARLLNGSSPFINLKQGGRVAFRGGGPGSRCGRAVRSPVPARGGETCHAAGRVLP